MYLTLIDIQKVFLPEIILLFCILVNIILGIFLGKTLHQYSSRIALISTIIPIIPFTINHNVYNINSKNGMFVQSPWVMLFQIMILISGFLVIILTQNIVKRFKYKSFEFYTILLTSLLGGMLMVSTNDFLTLFVSMEVLSVSLIMLISFQDKYRGKEAGIKYLIMSAVATGLYLLGASYIYGFCGDINFSTLAVNNYGQNFSLTYILGLILVIIGLCFKAGIIPFHNWIPDIYEGSSYPVAALISVVPKVAVFGILTRIAIALFLEIPKLSALILSIIAIFSIFIGLIGAYRQTNMKRFLGYSSIAHSGFIILLYTSFLTNISLSAISFYILTYIFMNIGVWSAAMTFINCTGSDDIKDYTGIFYIKPYYTTAFIICLIGLAGLPPASGFFSKIYLFIALYHSSSYTLFGLAIFSTIFGIWVYTNFMKNMFVRNTNAKILLTEKSNIKFVLFFCTIVTVFLFFATGYAIQFLQTCAVNM